MDDIVKKLSAAFKREFRDDDDSADQVNRKYTTVLLFIFAIVTSTSQYVGAPINCWTPKHFTANHAKYTNNVCWITDTYYLPFEDQVPQPGEPKDRYISYYRWVPIFLMLQAMFFYLPNVLWRELNTRSGVDISKIIETSGVYQFADYGGKRMLMMNYMVNQLDRYFGRKDMYARDPGSFLKNCLRRTCCIVCSRRFGNFLVFLYMIIKTLYVINVVGQIFVLNDFLGGDYVSFGFDVINATLNNADWTGSARFPKVTMCEFEKRAVGNVQRYAVQCVLSVNFFNEKIYLIIWFWFIFVAVYTIINFFAWILRFMFLKDRIDFVRKHLKTGERINSDEDRKLCRLFVRNYLRQDGVFILRLVNSNANSLACTDLTCALWDKFRDKPMIQQHGVDTWALNNKMIWWFYWYSVYTFIIYVSITHASIGFKFLNIILKEKVLRSTSEMTLPSNVG